MAIERKGSKEQKEDAQVDGYFNLVMEDQDGNEISVPFTLPLSYEAKRGERWHRSVLNKAKNNPDHEFVLKARVRLMTEDDEKDYNL